LGTTADVPVPLAPLTGVAMVMAVMGSSDSPKALEMVRRMVGAERPTRSVCRIVESTKMASVPFYMLVSAGPRGA
jgi:hypothetical protein